MSTSHPFQKLCRVKAASGLPDALLAASGPYVCCYSFNDGVVARWPASEDEGDGLSDNDAEHANGDGEGERPAKRQRISGSEEKLLSQQDSEESVEIISERTKGQRRKPKPVADPKLPDVSHILSTEDGRHIVVVTADDKCVRVLERRRNGRLRGISERCMPKRLCAIALTKDGKTIVAGDKFGDVYFLPLFHSENFSQPIPTVDLQPPVPEFKPSASELTVHTRGNLEALRQQQLQKKFKPKKEGLDFEHKLLLGHVSLLTDLAIAEIVRDQSNRQYILTADRDEHIRVSRGITQAHVIENYCLGHKDFVSRLCILPWQPGTLVAGSGEPSLKVYDWQRGLYLTNLLSSDDTTEKIAEYIKHSAQERSIDQLAISGIWTMSISNTQGFIVAALEGLPLLLSYFHDGEEFARTQILELPGNVLDIAVSDEKKLIIVSIDTVHDQYSMKQTRASLLDKDGGIMCFELDQETYVNTANTDSKLKAKLTGCPVWQHCERFHGVASTLCNDTVMAAVEPDEGKKQQKPHDVYSKLGEFLYGLENLRKHRGQEAAEADEDNVIDGNGTVEGEETIE